MNVELLGLPGSGKSTLVSALLLSLRAEGWQTVSLDALERKNARLKPLLRKNDIARHCYRRDQLVEEYPDFTALGEQILAPYPHQKAMFIQGLMQNALAKEMRRQVGLLCMHEGPWHRLLYGLHQRPDISISDLPNLLRGSLRPDAVIYINVTPEMSLQSIAERMKARGVAEPYEKAIHVHGSPQQLLHRSDLMQAVADFLDRNGVNVTRLEGLTGLEGMLAKTDRALELAQIKPKAILVK